MLLLIGAFILGFFANSYSTRTGGNFVGDFFLDNLPVVNLNPIIIEGALLTMLIGIVLLLAKPRYIIFTIKAAAIFITIRSFFVAVTHLGVYPNQIVPSNGFFDQLYVALNLQAGYFFSGHTGLPYLMGLIFWKEKFWRYFFFIVSASFGVSVLLAHIHYSIDVFAAPFMTYSIFKLAQYFFPKDFKLIEN